MLTVFCNKTCALQMPPVGKAQPALGAHRLQAMAKPQALRPILSLTGCKKEQG